MTTTALGELVDLQKGTSYSSQEVEDGEHTLVGLKCVRPGGGFWDGGTRPFSGDVKPRHRLVDGDVVIALTDLTQTGEVIGRPALVRRGDSDGEMVASLDLARITVRDPGRVDLRYLYYRLLAPDFALFADGYATGTTVRHLAPADVLKFSLELPTLSEQQRIAGSLALFDARMETLLLARDHAEQLVHALYQSWFVTFAGDGASQTLQASFRSRLTDSPIGRIPHDWTVEPLGDHIDVARGFSYTGAGLSEVGSGIPMHNLNSIRAHGGYAPEGIKYYEGKPPARASVRAGELLVANTDLTWDWAVIGSPALVPKSFSGESIFSHHVFRVRPKRTSPLTSTYVYASLLPGRLRNEVIGYANGTTVNMLPVDALTRPKLLVPPRPVVREFDDMVSILMDFADDCYERAEETRAARRDLLPALVTNALATVTDFEMCP